MASFEQMEELLNGDVVIYTLASSKNGIWQVRFKNLLNSGGHYVRKSTGKRDKGSAIRVALDLHNEHTARKNLGLSTGGVTISKAVDQFREGFDSVGQMILETAHRTYWKPYFKSTDLGKVNSTYIRQYFRWRVKNAKSHTTKHGWDASGGKTVSVSTLKLERNLMRRLFRMCKSDNMILTVPMFPKRFDTMDGTHKISSKKSRARLRLKEDYRENLEPYLESIWQGLAEPEWLPRPADESKEWNPSTNPYESRLKWKNRREPKRVTHNVWCHHKSRYDHAFFWFFSTMILNTGIRPSELVRLRHCDLVPRYEDGKHWLTITIDEDISKVGVERIAIPRDWGESFRRYLIWKQELKYRFNKEPQSTDFLFPSFSTDSDVSHVKDPADIIRKHLKKINLHKKKDLRSGIMTYFSAYSFRSFYITQRLLNGTNIYTVSKQVGSSIATISKYYDANETWELRHKMTAKLPPDEQGLCDRLEGFNRRALAMFYTQFENRQTGKNTRGSNLPANEE